MNFQAPEKEKELNHEVFYVCFITQFISSSVYSIFIYVMASMQFIQTIIRYYKGTGAWGFTGEDRFDVVLKINNMGELQVLYNAISIAHVPSEKYKSKSGPYCALCQLKIQQHQEYRIAPACQHLYHDSCVMKGFFLDTYYSACDCCRATVSPHYLDGYRQEGVRNPSLLNQSVSIH